MRTLFLIERKVKQFLSMDEVVGAVESAFREKGLAVF